MQFETYAPLAGLDFIIHGFTLRTTDDTRTDDYESRVARQFGFPAFARADQPHGNGVAVIDVGAGSSPRLCGADALITRQHNLALLVRCADCAPVYLIDRQTPAIALVHSGKKGTLANVVGETLKQIRADFAFIGPCIGPCHYEMNLWDELENQLAGLEVHNPRICTACNLDRYFSYRAEHGKTGRMFALLALR
jgi:copper oxidase (laccase) domain-containing protein